MSDAMSKFAHTIMEQKYSHLKKDGTLETWDNIAYRVSKHVLKAVDAKKELIQSIHKIISERKFIPGGRYLYASGRPFHQVQNCLLLRAEDSREGWADLMYKSTMALMTGAGIGVDYSNIRAEGKIIRRTGGQSTGPLALMQMVNEAGRGIMQGGSRRCLPASILITMEDGSKKPIKNINVGDIVQTRLGPKLVTNKFDQGEQELIEITTEYGTVVSTSNHKWLAADRTRRKTWMTTSDLSLNNKLYYHPFKEGPNSQLKSMDTNEAYMWGYFVGDGCAYSSNRTHEITFQFANNHPNKIKEISEVMRKFGTNPITRKGHGNCTELRCRNKSLIHIFQQKKYPNECPNLSWLDEYDTNVVASFLAGWFDADGYLGEESWKLANTHANARLVAKKLFKRLGILTTENGIEVKICSYQKAQFKKEIGRYMVKKFPSIDKETSEIPSSILQIKYLNSEPTWDIEVEDVHEFFANDFVSHNSAIWAGLSWKHADVQKFIHLKNWRQEVRELKEKDFNFPATLDGTNISVQLDDEFFEAYNNDKHQLHTQAHQVYWETVRQMLKTAEPGFTVDIGENDGETLRNACCEITSKDDSDICNLGSINMARIESLEDMKEVVELSTAFLLAGTVYSDVPYSQVDKIRSKNRRLGLGLMGLHEWLLLKGKKYEKDEELQKYLELYAESTKIAKKYSKEWELSCPIKTRAIAPTGTIGIIAETTTGIEPIFCAAFKRRYAKGTSWHYQYVLDPTAKKLVEKGINPDHIEDAYSLANDVERRIAFQAWLQSYVDHSISSTINLPSWGSELNNENTIRKFGDMLIKYLPNLRGITCYPDGARGGQPLTPIKYTTAEKHTGEIFIESTDVCEITGKGGSCGS